MHHVNKRNDSMTWIFWINFVFQFQLNFTFKSEGETHKNSFYLMDSHVLSHLNQIVEWHVLKFNVQFYSNIRYVKYKFYFYVFLNYISSKCTRLFAVFFTLHFLFHFCLLYANVLRKLFWMNRTVQNAFCDENCQANRIAEQAWMLAIIPTTLWSSANAGK